MLKSTMVSLTCALMVGCSSTEVVAPSMNVSVGQQLIDLKKAKDAGAISQREWEQQKTALINSVR